MVFVEKIIISNVNANNPNTEYGTPNGDQTNDSVFLLSDNEAQSLFSSGMDRIAYCDDSADFWLYVAVAAVKSMSQSFTLKVR